MRCSQKVNPSIWIALLYLKNVTRFLRPEKSFRNDQIFAMIKLFVLIENDKPKAPRLL